MENHRVVATNSILEIIYRLYGNINFDLNSTIISGAVVGACTLVGGLLGGRFGLLAGGAIGTSINSYFSSGIVTLRELLGNLHAVQLQNLLDLLSEEIFIIAINVLGQTLNPNLNFAYLLEMLSGNPLVRSNVIQTISNFLRTIHGNGLNVIQA